MTWVTSADHSRAGQAPPLHVPLDVDTWATSAAVPERGHLGRIFRANSM